MFFQVGGCNSDIAGVVATVRRKDKQERKRHLVVKMNKLDKKSFEHLVASYQREKGCCSTPIFYFATSIFFAPPQKKNLCVLHMIAQHHSKVPIIPFFMSKCDDLFFAASTPRSSPPSPVWSRPPPPPRGTSSSSPPPPSRSSSSTTRRRHSSWRTPRNWVGSTRGWRWKVKICFFSKTFFPTTVEEYCLLSKEKKSYVRKQHRIKNVSNSEKYLPKCRKIFQIHSEAFLFLWPVETALNWMQFFS